MSEQSISTEFTEDAQGNLNPQTSEDKFFGVQTEITKETTNTDNLEVEVVDENTPEPITESEPETTTEIPEEQLDKEIADYSKRAGDRINKIKKDYHDERRAKEDALKQSIEATTRLKTLLTENQRLQTLINQGSQVLNETTVANAAFAKENATEKFKKAYEEGDAEAMAAAQAELAKASVAETQAPQYAQQLQTQATQTPPQPEYQMEAETQAWVNKNSWFMNSNNPEHKRMSNYALYVDQGLQDEGLVPSSAGYYDRVDEALKKEFPNFFGVTTQDNSEVAPQEEKPQPSNVVAPVTRNTGNKNSRSVRLTSTQVKLARQLGITPEQYAKQLLQES